MRLPTLSPVLRTALAAAPLVLLSAGPACAQFVSREAIELHDQIYQLQQEVQQLQQQVARQGEAGSGYSRGNYPPPSSGGSDLVAQLLQKVENLEQQVRDLRGQVEEADNKIQQQGADLKKRIDDLAFQVQNPGVAAGQAPGAPAKPTAPAGTTTGTTTSPPPAPLGVTRAPRGAPAMPPPPPPRTAEQALNDGQAALARRDYPAAERAAHEVLTKFRTSPRAYDAQYLLAQALQGEGRYPQAAIAFDDAYNRSRKGSHAQHSLIGLAASLTAIKENQAACDTLSKLHAEFPREPADIRDAATALHKRAGCR